MKSLILSFVILIFLSGCSSSCSRSGRKSTGTKTFMVVKVIGVEKQFENLQLFIADTNGDGKADQELVNSSGLELQKGDSVTVVVQEKIVVNWYK